MGAMLHYLVEEQFPLDQMQKFFHQIIFKRIQYSLILITNDCFYFIDYAACIPTSWHNFASSQTHRALPRRYCTQRNYVFQLLLGLLYCGKSMFRSRLQTKQKFTSITFEQLQIIRRSCHTIAFEVTCEQTRYPSHE